MLTVHLELELYCLNGSHFEISKKQAIDCCEAPNTFIEGVLSSILAQQHEFKFEVSINKMWLTIFLKEDPSSDTHEQLSFLLNYFTNNRSIFTYCSHLQEAAVCFNGYSSQYRQGILSLLFIIGQAIAGQCRRIPRISVQGIIEPVEQFANFISDTLSQYSKLSAKAPFPQMPLETVNTSNRFNVAIHCDPSCAHDDDWLSRLILVIQPNTELRKQQPSVLELKKTALFIGNLLTLGLPTLEFSLPGFNSKEISILLALLQNPSLTKLRFSNRACCVFHPDASKIASLVKMALLACKNLTVLDVNCNVIQSLVSVLNGILAQLPKLSTFILRGTCSWSSKEIDKFGLRLSQCNQLRCIGIGITPAGDTPDALKKILQVLPKCRNLTELILGPLNPNYNHANARYDDCVNLEISDLMRLIPQLVMLLRLSINSRIFMSGFLAGLAGLVKALGGHPALQQVHFSDECRDQFSTSARLALLQVNKKLRDRLLLPKAHLTLIAAERRSQRNTTGPVNGPNNSRLFLPPEIHEYIHDNYLSSLSA